MATTTFILLLLFSSSVFANDAPSPAPAGDAVTAEIADIDMPSMSVAAINSSVLSKSQTVGIAGVSFRPDTPGLPVPTKVVETLVERRVPRVRLVNPDAISISAFEGSGIDLHLTLERLDLVQSFSEGQPAANDWLRNNVVPFIKRVTVSAIAVGVDILTQYPNMSKIIMPAVRNMYAATRTMGMGWVAVSTGHSYHLVLDPVPPSSAQFNSSDAEVLSELLAHNSDTGAPFMVNIFPFFLYEKLREGEGTAVSLPFVMFEAREDQYMTDPVTKQQYRNMFELMVDSVVVALVRSSHAQQEIMIIGTGWPNKDRTTRVVRSEASFLNAAEYNERLVSILNLRRGSPLRPHSTPITYLYSLFDEDTGSEWDSWGIWTKDLAAKYNINFMPDPEELEEEAGMVEGPEADTSAIPGMEWRLFMACLAAMVAAAAMF